MYFFMTENINILKRKYLSSTFCVLYVMLDLSNTIRGGTYANTI